MFEWKVVLAACAAAAVCALNGAVISDYSAAEHFPRLTPQVRELEIAGGSCPLPAKFTVAAPDRDDLALDKLARELKRRRSDRAFVVVGEGAPAFCRLKLVPEAVKGSKQGYTLAVAPEGIEIAASTPAGLFYGVQTLRNLIRDNAEADTLPVCRIVDWPDLELRGFYFRTRHIFSHGKRIPGGADLESFLRSVEEMAALKLNWAVLEFAENLPWDENPFPKRTNYLTIGDIEKIKEVCRKNHIEITPLVQALAHCMWLCDHPEYESMVEGKISELHSPWFASACPQSELAWQLTSKAIVRAMELFKPRYMHVGLDEIYIGNMGQGTLCPKCRGKDLYQLLKDYVLRLEETVFEHGSTPMIWFDSFYERRFWHYIFFRRGDPRVDRIIGDLDRRTVLNYWNYNPHAREDIALYYGRDRKFVLTGASYCRHPLNAETMPRLIKRVGGIGNYLTYWSHVNADMLAHPAEIGNYALAATAINAENSWNTKVPTLLKQQKDPAFEARKIFDPATPRRRAGMRMIPIPLGKTVNFGFGSSPEFPLFDAKTLATAKRELASGVEKFRLLADADHFYGIALSGGKDSDSFSAEPVKIPVGRKLDGLSFLMTASRPDRLTPMTPEDRRINMGKPQIGTLKILYADGGSAAVPLTYRGSLVDWNSQVSAYGCRFVWRGKDKRDAVASFVALDWDNPEPEREIAAVEFSTACAEGVAPALLALSGLSAAAEEFPAEEAGQFHAKVRERAPRPQVTETIVTRFDERTLEGLLIYNEPQFQAGIFQRRFASVPGYSGKVLEFRIPPVRSGVEKQRVYIDITLPEKLPDFRTVTADLMIDHPQYLVKESMYLTDGKQVDPACLSLFRFFDRHFRDWQTIEMPLRYCDREHGGVTAATAKKLRLSFWFCNPEKVVLRIGRCKVTTSPGKLRRPLFTGDYLDMWYNDRETEWINKYKR